MASLETSRYLSTSTTTKTQAVTLSEQELVDCSHENDGCDGGDMRSAFEYLERVGFESDKVYPYTGQDGTCKYNAKTILGKVASFVSVPSNNVAQLEAALANTVVSIGVDADIWQFYSEGIVSKHCGHNIDHGVAAVGYGTEDGQDYWIVRNSWSADWGEKGYIRILKSGKGAKGMGMCGILSESTYSMRLV